MKKCPVCGANVFEDMDTCYNCLHNFKNDNDDHLRANLSASIPEVNIPQTHSIHGINANDISNKGVYNTYQTNDFTGLDEGQSIDKFFEDKNISRSQVGDGPISCGVAKIEPDQALDYLNSYYSFLGSYLQSRDSKMMNKAK